MKLLTASDVAHDLQLAEARRLAGRRGRVFGDKPVWLYGDDWNPSDVFIVWLRELHLNEVPTYHLSFWLNPMEWRYEALQDAGTLSGWPYYICLAWCAAPRASVGVSTAAEP